MARKKPCDLCCEEQFYVENGSNRHALHVEIYPESGVLSVYSYAEDNAGETEELQFELPLQYCPSCGRKIGW